jgi:putative effector of murein hydrolase LrgA (UPF0299 family)
MKPPSNSLALVGPLAVLLALFASGGVIGRTLGLPLPASAVGLALVVLGLRVAAMAAAVHEVPAPAGTVDRAHGREPALRAANG